MAIKELRPVEINWRKFNVVTKANDNTHTHTHTNSDPRQRDDSQADREIDTSFRLAYGQARRQSVKNARVLTGVCWLSSPLARCLCV